MNGALRRYWFTFEKLDGPNPLNVGCGVTAYDDDDASVLLRERVFAGMKPPGIVGCERDVDVSALDPKHVRPNMGVVVIRGIWFPQGYE